MQEVISRATTDSGKEVKFDPANKAEISNLMAIYMYCADIPILDIEQKYQNQGYGQFKKDLAEHVVNKLAPIQQKYKEIRASGEIRQILSQGAARASVIAEETLHQVKERMGFLV